MIKKLLLTLLVVIAIIGCGDDEMDRYYGDTLIQDLPGKTFVPDDAFEKYLIQYGYDDEMDDYVSTDRIESITEINLDWEGYPNETIKDLTGIQNFRQLEVLKCNENDIRFIDASSNKKLRVLECRWNLLDELNISQNKSLTHLNCQRNQLKTLNVSQNKLLIELKAINPISELDVSETLHLNSCLVELEIPGRYPLMEPMD